MQESVALDIHYNRRQPEVFRNIDGAGHLIVHVVTSSMSH